jgi:hypothetical protein
VYGPDGIAAGANDSTGDTEGFFSGGIFGSEIGPDFLSYGFQVLSQSTHFALF